ncbi:MAG: 7-cyano-7-deazaguanine synthase [bacterium]
MKALALLSGGLDSTLAIKVVLEQGIDVVAVNFYTPFCLCNRKGSCRHEARRVAEEFGIELKVINLSSQYLKIVKSPKHGYGKNLNPCIDCRILMLKHAKKLMKEKGASFLITGEVLGQRPMSQHFAALKIIERESDLKGLVVRPLSAKLLPLSIPEKEGWVNRKKLLEIRGRSRKPQIDLAAKYGIADYPCPAGGCLLTDRGFAQRMRDLMSHSEISLNDVELLKMGRHFRLSLQTKLVVGRNKEENQRLLRLAKIDDICFKPVKVKGPIGIGRGDFDQTTIFLASKIVARYSDAHDEVRIAYQRLPGEEIGSTRTRPMNDMELQKLRI